MSPPFLNFFVINYTNRLIENSGNYILFCPEFRQELPVLERTQDAKTESKSILMSKGQFGEGSDTINRIVHNYG